MSVVLAVVLATFGKVSGLLESNKGGCEVSGICIDLHNAIVSWPLAILTLWYLRTIHRSAK
jgi:hypothetical protein